MLPQVEEGPGFRAARHIAMLPDGVNMPMTFSQREKVIGSHPKRAKSHRR